jgi:hypothetical protein
MTTPAGAKRPVVAALYWDCASSVKWVHGTAAGVSQLR